MKTIKSVKPVSDAFLGPRPDFLDELLNVTEALAQDANKNIAPLAYVRVEFFVYKSGNSFQTAFAELTFQHQSCRDLFARKEIWANKFYGFVGSHPEYDIWPECVFDVWEQIKARKSME